jgi:formylglycine-generating enzyme required for sulfatase activity
LNQPTCEAGECIVRGPPLVKVGDFYVDSTEVTAAQYQQFLDAKGDDTSGQPGICSWNTAYKDADTLINPDTWPMTDVDWCDAFAFCAWADKHLCGAVAGGAIARADLLVAGKSQWFSACGGPNGASHPNANSVCNSSDGFSNVAPVATFPDCEGYYPGLFDMEGNVAEWVDSCDGNTGASDTCYLVGGNIYDKISYCTEAYADYQRSSRAPSFGFRCCSG